MGLFPSACLSTFTPSMLWTTYPCSTSAMLISEGRFFKKLHGKPENNYNSLQTTVHFAFRISPSQTECPVIYTSGYKDCVTFFQKNTELLEEMEDPFQIYPINLMRNIARRGAKSDLHLIVDTDMVMSTNFAKMVKPVANRMIDGMNKQVLVVRWADFWILGKMLQKN